MFILNAGVLGKEGALLGRECGLGERVGWGRRLGSLCRPTSTKRRDVQAVRIRTNVIYITVFGRSGVAARVRNVGR